MITNLRYAKFPLANLMSDNGVVDNLSMCIGFNIVYFNNHVLSC